MIRFPRIAHPNSLPQPGNPGKIMQLRGMADYTNSVLNPEPPPWLGPAIEPVGGWETVSGEGIAARGGVVFRDWRKMRNLGEKP